MRLSSVGDDVWVGDFRACDERSGEFGRVIHLWRESNRAEGRLCRHVASGTPPGLAAYWREWEPLATLSVPFPDLMEYARGPGRLLVHCAGGICRSATIAVAAKVARGRCPSHAVGDVYRGLWAAHGYCPCLPDPTLAEVFAWAARPAIAIAKEGG